MSKKRKTTDELELAQRSHGNGLDGAGADNRRKKSAASRIGRACDRCQHRKLACDPSPGGCPPCQKVNAWCTVTDPLTGTPTYRGEFEYLEKRVQKQHRDIQDLLAKLRAAGQNANYHEEEETAEDRRYKAWKAVKDAGETRPWDRDERTTQGSKNLGPPPVPSRKSEDDGQEARSPPRFNELDNLSEPLAPESYVGLTTARGHPVSSRLNMFGWEIDLASFTTPDADDPKFPPPSHDNPIYDKSYRSSLASIYGTQKRCQEPQLPARKEEMGMYAGMMIQVLNVYTPVMHKNKFLAMVNDIIGNPQANPTIAQKVILHMTVATITMHQALRNQDEARMQMMTTADLHYHFCLGHFGDLLVGDSLEAIQALALICLFTRNFPKPEICWAISYRTFARLVELSYHRAPRKKRRDIADLSVYEIEMQKRLFWTIFVCCFVTSGKLGRPMPLRQEDVDVDYPSSIPEDALTDAGIDEQIMQQQPCEFQPHIELCKLSPIYMDVCSTIYTAKRGMQGYKAFVAKTEQRLQAWHEQLPDRYKKSVDDEAINDLDRMSIAYMNFFMYELRLLIHHPSLTMVHGGPPNHEDLRVCLSVSHGMLSFVKVMQRLRALECTWHTCALFMLAVQTTLYAHSTLKDEITSEKFDECRDDMQAWLSIIGDMGMLLGSKNKLQQKVHQQIYGGITQLQHVLQAKVNSAKVQSVEHQSRPEIKTEESQPRSNIPPHTPQVHAATYTAYNGLMNPVNSVAPSAATYGQQPGSNHYQDVQAYSSMPQNNYPYSNSVSSTMASSNYSAAPSSVSNGYQNGPATAAYGMQQMPHHTHASASPASPYTTQSQQTPFTSNGYYPAYAQQAGMSDPTWQQYIQALNTNTITGSPHSTSSGHTADYQPAAANALLQLGNAGTQRDSSGMLSLDMGANMGTVANYGAVTAAQQWPLGFMEDARTGFDQGHTGGV